MKLKTAVNLNGPLIHLQANWYKFWSLWVAYIYMFQYNWDSRFSACTKRLQSFRPC